MELDSKWKRFFILFYIASAKNNTKCTGSMSFKTEGTYINKDICEAQIVENTPFEISDIVFTNIIELSKDDYITFYLTGIH